jgi:hypothetical protein
MVDVVALSPPRRRIQAYRAKHACFNMSETYDRLGLKHLQVPCITGGYRMHASYGTLILPHPYNRGCYSE